MFSEDIKKLENEILALKQQSKVSPVVRMYNASFSNFNSGDILRINYADGDQPIISNTFTSSVSGALSILTTPQNNIQYIRVYGNPPLTVVSTRKIISIVKS